MTNFELFAIAMTIIGPLVIIGMVMVDASQQSRVLPKPEPLTFQDKAIGASETPDLEPSGIEPYHLRSIMNWGRIPKEQRDRCLSHLRSMLAFLGGERLLQKWVDMTICGFAIGSDELLFHFGTGMAVRNILRNVLPDDKLPDIADTSGWDDFYYGALDALVNLEMEKFLGQQVHAA